MYCSKQVTLLAIRAVRERLYIGVRESEARSLMDSALAAAGLSGGFSLVLFGGIHMTYVALLHID